MTMPMPAFFNPDNAFQYDYEPDLNALTQAAEDYRKQNKIDTAMASLSKGMPFIEVIGIDLQKDFCFPWDATKNRGGTLFVGGRSGTGAMDDNVRIAQFIYRNLPFIAKFTPTMDTHLPFQIFFRTAWLMEDGSYVPAFTTIMVKDDKFVGTQGDPTSPSATWFDVRINPLMSQFHNFDYPWLLDYVAHYCGELQRQGKYALYIWPIHCIAGSAGYALAGVINEARMFLSWTRGLQSNPMFKGSRPLTENYSVYRPEVLVAHDGVTAVGQRDTKIIEKLQKGTRVVYCGQAASHCVLSSIDDHLRDIQAFDPALAKHVYVLKDCMSSVVVPGGPDFTDKADAAFAAWDAAGMNIVNSTDPIESWPGIGL